MRIARLLLWSGGFIVAFAIFNHGTPRPPYPLTSCVLTYGALLMLTGYLIRRRRRGVAETIAWTPSLTESELLPIRRTCPACGEPYPVEGTDGATHCRMCGGERATFEGR